MMGVASDFKSSQRRERERERDRDRDRDREAFKKFASFPF